MSTLPEFYFRIRENGAIVFRVDTENRQQRIELEQIAVVNVKNGEIKGHGNRALSDDEVAAITKWRDERRDQLASREVDDILRTVDRLNLTAAWAQQKATPDELAQITDALLLAMHDLRSVLVRKKSDQMRNDN